MSSKPLPPFKLSIEPMNEEARQTMGFRWAAPDVGTRSKLGGAPDFIQSTEWPRCQHCRNNMTFYAQLDSVGDNITIADCGMIYVFICFGCFGTTSLIQSA
jgi:hypothetical protein